MIEKTGMSSVISALSNIRVDTSSVEGQTVDMDVVNWYDSRFRMFKEDGVPAAIQSYIEHMRFDDSINQITRSFILHKALSKEE